MRVEIPHRHPLHPVGQRVRPQTLGSLDVRLIGDAVEGRGRPNLTDILANPGDGMVRRGFDGLRIHDSRGKDVLEQFPCLSRVKHVADLINAELVKDHRKFLFKHRPNAELD